MATWKRTYKAALCYFKNEKKYTKAFLYKVELNIK
jgi:hypothetical protein